MKIFYLEAKILAIDGKSWTKVRPYIELYSDEKYSYIIGLTSNKNRFSETLFAKDYPQTLKVDSNYFGNQIYQVETNFLNNNIKQISEINDFDEFRIVKNISKMFYQTLNFGLFEYIKQENENVYMIKPLFISNKLYETFNKHNDNYQKQLKKWHRAGIYKNDLTLDEVNNALGNILIDFRIEKNREFLNKEVTLENFEMMKSTIDRNQKEIKEKNIQIAYDLFVNYDNEAFIDKVNLLSEDEQKELDERIKQTDRFKTSKAQTIAETLSPDEVNYLKKQHELAHGSKKWSDLVLEYDKNRKQSKTSTKPKTKDDEWERER